MIKKEELAQVLQLLASGEEINIDLGLELLQSLNGSVRKGLADFAPYVQANIELQDLAFNSKLQDDNYWKNAFKRLWLSSKMTVSGKNMFVRNQLTLRDNIRYLRNIEQLVWHRSDLSQLPKGLFELPKLERLDVSNNELKALPDELGNCSSLKILILNHNQLEALPADIGKLQNLEFLYVSHNKLTSLPASISELKNLRFLHLFNNPLDKEAIPPILLDSTQTPAHIVQDLKAVLGLKG